MLDTGVDERTDCGTTGHLPRRAVPEGHLSPMIKKLLLLTTLVAGILAFAVAPASAQYPEDPSATIDDTSVLAGGTVNISGVCPGETSVDVLLEGELLGSIPVEADGTFSGPITIPADTPPGTYTLQLLCGDEVLSVEITVSADGTVTPPGGGSGSGSGSGDGSLARTGSEVDGLLKIGGGLLLAGAAVLLVTTKRRTASI